MPTTSIKPDTTLGQLLRVEPFLGPFLECLEVNATRDGGRTLAELCQSRGLEFHTVVRMLGALREAGRQIPAACVELMTPAQLCDHLEDAHRNLRVELTRLDRLTGTLAKEHAAKHPKLLTFRKCFLAFQRRFLAHLHGESAHLFPVIRRCGAIKKGARHDCDPVKLRLAQLEQEHGQTDEELAKLRTLLDGPSPTPLPQAAVRNISEAIARLERNLHEQIYKENRILFPKALSLP